MMSFSIILLVLALVMIVLGIRGRVIERGRFCRSCRFDLQGISPDDPTARCPECGRLVSMGRTPRRVMRKRMRVVIVLGVLVFLVSGGYLGIQLSGSAGAIYRVMPNPVVLNFSIWGSDDALDALIDRINTDNDAITEDQWDALIEHAFIRLDATDIEWNPHWGQVLYVATLTNRLSIDELKRYIEQISKLNLSVKDRVLAGAEDATVSIELVSHRASASTGGQLPYRYLLKIKRSGLEGWEREGSAQFDTMHPSGLRLNMSTAPVGGWFSSSVATEIDLTRDGATPAIDEELRLVVETSLEVVPNDGGEALFSIDHRFTSDITVLDPDAELVGRLIPTERIDKLAECITLHPILVKHPDDWVDDGSLINPMISYTIQLQDTPHPIAYTINFLSPAGEELELGNLVELPRSGINGLARIAQPKNDDPAQAERIRRIAREMLEQGKATLILRVTPALANDAEGIDEVLDLDILVRNVQVNRDDGNATAGWSSDSPDGVKGTALERSGTRMSTDQTDPNEDVED
jgi:hypothetical protein